MAIINVRNRVQNIVTGRAIVLIGTKATALLIITSTGVCITSIVRIIPRTSVGVHGIVTDAHAIALAQECFDSVVCFTGKVRLLINTDTPTDRVDTIVAFSIHHKTIGVSIELLNTH